MNEQSHSLLPTAAATVTTAGGVEQRTTPNGVANVEEHAGVVKIIQKKRSKRWIMALTVLCLLLTTALVACYIRYKQCCTGRCSSGGSGSGQGGQTDGFKAPKSSELVDSTGLKSLGVHHTNWTNSRLPTNLVPYYYNINLRIDVHEKKFNGSCTIYFKCVYSTNIVVIHAETNLEMSSLPVVNETESERSRTKRRSLEIKTMTFNSFYSYHVIQLKSSYFVEGRYYSITFGDFSSSITDNLKGLYMSSYTFENQTKSLVVSQLQPVDARRVFPGFDEPIYKAVFKISIEHQKEFSALSNMPEIETTNLADGWRRTSFDVTPKMSTYILAFVVSDFKYKSTVGPNGIKVRVWTREDYINTTDYAVEVIPKIFQYFERYFNISEVVPKSDHFASPDFNAGAMENWGLVIYKESTLLYDEKKSSLEDEFYVLLVISHEISHSWFGNIATLKWWDNLWMNEAFANTLMYFAMDHIRPEFKVLESLVVHDIFNVMEKDSVESSHPVSVTVENPKEVQQYFDEISYDKGLSVLRMLRGFIGDDKFKLSLQNYVQRNMYSNSDMEELFELFSKTINYKYNVSQIMNNWLTKEGYPVVNVKAKAFEANDTLVYDLSQEYFLLYKSTNNTKNLKWVIPFTYKIQDSGPKMIWMNLTDSQVQVPLKQNANKWFIGNLDSIGYFRVNYDVENWKLIINQLKSDHNAFSTTERAALIHDSFTFARIGNLDYSIALDLASYLPKEDDYVPWKSFFRSITYLDSMLSSSSCYGLFQKFVVAQIRDIYKKLGWDDTGTYLERLLRSNIIKYASYFELDDAIKRALMDFPQYLSGNKSEKHLVEAVLCTGIKYNGYQSWKDLFNKSMHAIPAEYTIFTQALVCSREPWILKGYLEMALRNDNLIRLSEIRRIFSYFSLSAVSRNAYFEFLLKNWDDIYKKFGTDAFTMTSILETLSVGVGDEFLLDRVKDMLANGAGAASSTPNLIYGQINSNIQWVKNHEKNVCDYLEVNLAHYDRK